jgi:hypothetical protein
LFIFYLIERKSWGIPFGLPHIKRGRWNIEKWREAEEINPELPPAGNVGGHNASL